MNAEARPVNVGIGFVTGRKNFKQVLRSYLGNWNDSGILNQKKYVLHLFAAYDLKYTGTEASDYQITDEDILGSLGSAHYLGAAAIANEARQLTKRGIISQEEAKLVFGEGYAMKRNAVLYFALKLKMDSLIFLDDDEYPIANLKMGDSLVWKGQEVLATHILNLRYADMTHGYHCGYVSPIPQINFNEVFCLDDFRVLIEAISNDILNWDSVQQKMENGGVTYADLDTINSRTIELVEEHSGMKFISGANLGINLKRPEKLFPFYNPPGSRGEDAFLSTCLSGCEIRKVPCYAFHDGFSAYPKLLSGTMPNRLKIMNVSSNAHYKRFLRACVGWVRYKPLLTYITRRADYGAVMAQSNDSLSITIPKLCSFFGNEDFQNVRREFSAAQAQVEEHFSAFERTKRAWRKIVAVM